MKISHLRLTNFRNHASLKLTLTPLTVLIGPNGTGKTNVLEAIAILSTTRSPRTNRDREVIKWGENSARIEGQIKKDDQATSLAVAFTTEPSFTKTYLKNTTPQRAVEFLGILPSVLFSPEALDLIYGPPALRRRFLDILLCQTSHQYTSTLWRYNQVIKERNHLLLRIVRQEAALEELKFWNNELVELGSYIIVKRLETVSFLNNHLAAAYQLFSGSPDQLQASYEASVTPEAFSQALSKIQEKEIRFTSTLIGPHRDDVVFSLNSHSLATHGSRGECRSAVLSLKVAEVDYHKEKLQEPPILLLDDIFSELDIDRRGRLGEIVYSQQTLITTTDLDHLTPKLQKTAKIIQLPIKEKNDGTHR